MKHNLKLKLQNIGIITMLGVGFGLVYNHFYYEHNFTEYLEAGTIGFLLGIIVGIFEEFILFRFFKRKSFVNVTLIRSVLYALLTSLTLSSVLSIEVAMVEEIPYQRAFFQYLGSEYFSRDFIFTSIFLLLMMFALQVILLIGKSNFFLFLFGWYHQPSEVSRVFMFVDLKGSTSIAEKLSNKDYSLFVQDYFYDISDAIAMYSGEIYQFVGDEVVVTWKFRKDNLRCIHCFFKMQDIIQERRDKYIDKFGLTPEFKAGIHAGKVIATQVGKYKKELVYHGDVLNTTARIEGQCNPLDEVLLISDTLKNRLEQTDNYSLKAKGAIELRGKANKLMLYGVSKSKT